MRRALCVVFHSRVPLPGYYSFEFDRHTTSHSLNPQFHTDPNEFNGVESYVSSLLFKTNVDWIPTRTSWRIEMDTKIGPLKNGLADTERAAHYPLADELARMRSDMENSQRATQALIEGLLETTQCNTYRIRHGTL